jgi:hypothetical protein
MARRHTGVALQALIEVAKHGENESARVAAANAILDRGWGKPIQALADDPATTPVVITIAGDDARL